MQLKGDPIGQAIHHFSKTGKESEIIVESDLCDDDVIPVSYLFRNFDSMPELEKIALSLCRGSILDVGAGAGCHARYLQAKNFAPTCLEISPGAIDYLSKHNLTAVQKTIFELNHEQFDTILILMNGIGLAQSMDQLPAFLLKLKNLLRPGGKILCDSTDIAYLFQEEDGSFLINIAGKYYGEMQFNMKYGSEETGWFPWLYIDFENLSEHASRVGLKCTHLYEGENYDYLACLEHLD